MGVSELKNKEIKYKNERPKNLSRKGEILQDQLQQQPSESKDKNLMIRL